MFASCMNNIISEYFGFKYEKGQGLDPITSYYAISCKSIKFLVQYNASSQIKFKEKEICDLEGEITERDVKIQRLINLIKSEDAYKYMQSMMTEAVTLIFENEQKYLRTKPNPALKSAERVGELEQQFLELMGKHLEMKNKFESELFLSAHAILFLGLLNYNKIDTNVH